MLVSRGIVCLCDFGLARMYGEPLKPYTHMVVTLWCANNNNDGHNNNDGRNNNDKEKQARLFTSALGYLGTERRSCCSAARHTVRQSTFGLWDVCSRSCSR